jgi:hypothetical protein
MTTPKSVISPHHNSVVAGPGVPGALKESAEK